MFILETAEAVLAHARAAPGFAMIESIDGRYGEHDGAWVRG